eukprot:m.9485 g.9485  ORF g.9485 m.9485 type:complete len:1163 (+) comp3531_c0_seq1:125-3613(+)
MPSRAQLDVHAWGWVPGVSSEADITTDHLRRVYRLDVSACLPNSCRRNCSGHPCCLRHLGEKRWSQEVLNKASQKRLKKSPTLSLRDEGHPAGLTNLGATCYANSLLQLWFSNPRLRSAVFDWRPRLADGEESGDERVMLALQRVFASLQLTKQSWHNPCTFIDALQLSHSVQQDAQEFYKLFFALLERQFSAHKDAWFHSLIRTEFTGQYVYRTTCGTCGKPSDRPSDFHDLELHIQGVSDFLTSLRGFFSVEELQGPNQYHCGNCNAKHDATRRIVLKTLPPTLSFCLLRFVYDMKTFTKRKLSHKVRFPVELNMREFVADATEDLMYDLHAIVLHRGPSAQSGHYLIQIKNQEGTWFEYDDESTQAMESESKCGEAESADIYAGAAASTGKKKRSAKPPQGFLDSTSVYMLEYRRRSTSDVLLSDNGASDAKTAEPEPTLASQIVAENMQFEDTVSKARQEQESRVSADVARGMRVLEVYDSMACNEVDEETEWVPTSWIERWLRMERPRVNATDPEASSEDAVVIDDDTECKAPTSAVVDRGSDGPHGETGTTTRTKADAQGSTAGIDAVLTDQASNSTPDAMVVEKLSTTVQQVIDVDNLPDQAAMDQKQSDDSPVLLNNLLCKHNKLGPNAITQVKLIRSDAAQLLRPRVARNEPPLRGMTALCRECVVDRFREEKLDDRVKDAQGQVNAILKHVGRTYSGEGHWISKDALRLWGHYNPTKTPAALQNGQPFNATCQCEHGNLSLDEARRRVIPTEAWMRIRQFFENPVEFGTDVFPCELCLQERDKDAEASQTLKLQALSEKENLGAVLSKKRCLTPQDLPEGGEEKLYVMPEIFLQQWRYFVRNAARCRERPSIIDFSELICEHGDLHVDVAVPDAEMFEYVTEGEWSQFLSFGYEVGLTGADACHIHWDAEFGLKTSPRVCEQCKQQRDTRLAQAPSKFFNEILWIRKVDKLPTPQDDGSTGETAEAMPVVRKNVRRSGRSRRQGTRQVRVSGTTTVKELKVLVLGLFLAIPSDQRLFFKGKELTDNMAVLSGLGITKGSEIMFYMDPELQFQEVVGTSEVEHGFKGTGLSSVRATKAVDDCVVLDDDSDASASVVPMDVDEQKVGKRERPCEGLPGTGTDVGGGGESNGAGVDDGGDDSTANKLKKARVSDM